MIDKLEVRVPERTSFTGAFECVFEGMGLSSSRHYKLVADLRPYSYNSILHYSCNHGKERNHKLELVDTGAMTLAEMTEDIQRVFKVDARNLSIMRLDLAVDIEGIGVSWFAEHTRVQYKRWLANLGVIDTAEMGNREIQTLYYGKRPNVIRIYNKIEEFRTQFRRMLRHVPAGVTPPTFEERFGVPESGYVLTRVERQMGGGKIPSALETVGDLRNCDVFNPFDGLEFISDGRREPIPSEYKFMEYLAGMQLRHLAETQGMHAAITHITRHSKRNKKWALKKFGDFLPVPTAEDLTRERLFELFQRSMAVQFQGHKEA
jgi:hypothetical protein